MNVLMQIIFHYSVTEGNSVCPKLRLRQHTCTHVSSVVYASILRQKIIVIPVDMWT